MWQFILGLAVGGVVGFFVCSALTLGKYADTEAELADCEERNRRLAQG